ncbi:MAG: nucleotide exchange factor GrpE [Candidatus Zixiibacteriota bacterium]
MEMNKDKDPKENENDVADGDSSTEASVTEKAAENGQMPETEKPVADIIEEYKARVAQLEDRYLRLVAEFDNYKKRTGRQFEDLLKNSNENIIVSILNVIDDFERALAAGKESTDYKSLLAGTELIYQNLYNILKKEGVVPLEAVGQPFNPSLHDAMMQMESGEYPDGVVIQEMVKGYRLNGKVIRHAKVIVSKGKPQEESEPEDNK